MSVVATVLLLAHSAHWIEAVIWLGPAVVIAGWIKWSNWRERRMVDERHERETLK